MAIDLSNARHVSLMVDEIVKAATALEKVIADLNAFGVFWTVNGVQAALVAGGASFPVGFNLAPAQVIAARNAIAGALTAATNSLTAAEILNLDRVIQNVGVRTGTG